MAQAFLGANPGTFVTDAEAPILLEDEDVQNTTVTGDWVEVDFPGNCVVVLELGAAAASSNLRVEIEGSDDGDSISPSGVVSYGAFDSIGGDDDNEIRVMDAQIYKKYVRAVATESGNAEVTIKSVTLAPPQFHMGNSRTA